MFNFYLFQAKPAVDYSDLLNQKRQQEIRHRNSADVFARDAGTSGGILRSSTRQIFVHQSFNLILLYGLDYLITVEPCILEQIDHLWGFAVAKPMI